jgi:hypothetical protein
MSDINANPMLRRDFLEGLGKLSLGAAAAGSLGIGTASAQNRQEQKKWTPVSQRKVRVGIVGYGVCRFGAAFGFQDHPNVDVVAVSDLMPDRRNALMKACRPCGIPRTRWPTTSASPGSDLPRYPVAASIRVSRLMRPEPTNTTTRSRTRSPCSRQARAARREC